jgi:tetratricopeptide (TPR) repeat protein
MNDAVRRAPDDVAVLIPRGATLLEVSRSASDPQEAPRLLALGVSDYEKVLALQAPYFKYLPEHARGELLFGLAEGLYRLGRPEDARRYLERLLAEAKDSSYRDLAAAWLANPDDARGREHGCVTCHAKTTARETRWTDVTTRLEAAAVKGSARDLQEIRRDLLARLSGQAAEHEPLAQYAVAYTAWRLAFVPMVPETDRDRMLDDAVERLQRFEGNTQEHAEALALLGGVYGEQIGRSPIQGMLKGPRAGRALDRAASMAPRNPRVAVLQAINAFNTPAVFGGGVDKAEQLLTTALELFAAEPPDKAWPNWGRFDAHAWLGQVRLRRGDAAGAQSEYDKALAIAPESQWVRNVLLPAVSRSR